MFYRRARISRLLFQTQILPGAEFRQYAAGDVIANPSQPERLHLIVLGRADGVAQVSRNDIMEAPLPPKRSNDEWIQSSFRDGRVGGGM
jgi:hypothetical protein